MMSCFILRTEQCKENLHTDKLAGAGRINTPIKHLLVVGTLGFSVTPLIVVFGVAATVDDKIEEGFGEGTEGCDLNIDATEVCGLGVNDGICLGGTVAVGRAAAAWVTGGC